MKITYLELIFLTVLFSLFSVSVPKYRDSNLKKFLAKLGLPDIPTEFQDLGDQNLSNNETIPIDEEDSSEDKKEPDDDKEGEKEDGKEGEKEDGKEGEKEEGKEGEKEDGKEGEKDERKEEEKEDGKEEESGDDKEEEKQDGKEDEDEKKEEDKEEESEGDDEKDKEKKGEKSYVNIKCLWVQKANVYSLQALQNKENDYKKEFQRGKVIFNFCQNTKDDPESTVLWENNETNITVAIAGSVDPVGTNKNEWAELNDDSEPGLILTLSHPKEKQCNGKYHQTFFKIYCDPEMADEDFLESVDLSEFTVRENACKHYITARSIYGCALNDWYLLKRVLDNYKWIFGTGLILIGLFLCMYGNKCRTPTIIVVMGLIGCYVISIIFLNFLSSFIKTEKHLWMLLGAGFLVGGFIGFVIKAKITIFTVLLGISMGYSIAEVVYQFIQGFIDWNPTYVYYGTIGVCCIAGIAVGFILLETVFVVGTSVVGGYVAMRGATVFFGNYIDEGQFADLIRNKEYEQLEQFKTGWTYAYLALWIVLTLFGVYYQCIGHRKSNSTSKNHDYKKIEDKKGKK